MATAPRSRGGRTDPEHRKDAVTDQTLTRPGATLAYEVDGAGPVVVQAHGLTAGRDADLAILDVRGLASRGHRLVRYDAAGHGASAGSDDHERYRWPVLADDLLALIDAVGADGPVDAVGVSMGTGTILTAAVRHPERFRRLVLALPPTAWDTRPAQAAVYRQMADLIDEKGWDALTEWMTSSPIPLPPVLAERGAPPADPAAAGDRGDRAARRRPLRPAGAVRHRRPANAGAAPSLGRRPRAPALDRGAPARAAAGVAAGGRRARGGRGRLAGAGGGVPRVRARPAHESTECSGVSAARRGS
jgi:pimeloyl-ACP methyl ester carboxylesterase